MESSVFVLVLDLHLFADDSNLFYSHRSLQTLETTVNNELSKIHEWLCANNLSLNTHKTNFSLFHASQKYVADSFSLHLNNKQITEITCIKYLSVLIDSNLNWKEHILNMSKKNNKKHRHYLQTQAFCQHSNISSTILCNRIPFSHIRLYGMG